MIHITKRIINLLPSHNQLEKHFLIWTYSHVPPPPPCTGEGGGGRKLSFWKWIDSGPHYIFNLSAWTEFNNRILKRGSLGPLSSKTAVWKFSVVKRESYDIRGDLCKGTIWQGKITK